MMKKETGYGGLPPPGGVREEETRKLTSTYSEIVDHWEGRPAAIPCPLCPNLGYLPGTLTEYAGCSGNGKSLVTGQIAQHLAYLGEKSCIASFEMPPWQTSQRMFRQAFGRLPAGRDEYRYLSSWVRWLDSRVFLYEAKGKVCVESVLETYLHYVENYGVKHFWVDNLMRVVKTETDTEILERFISGLKDIATGTGTCCHLVCHTRKRESEFEEIGKFDIRGSSVITDIADNVVIIQRNKAKESRAGTPLGNADGEEPDSTFWLCKYRYDGSKEIKAKLWFNPVSGAFSTTPDRRPPAFVPAGFWSGAAAGRQREDMP